MSDPIDLLQIKIDKAKSELPEATRQAIEAVDWKAAVLSMRASKGYSFEQLGDLELETELLLAGLVSPESYPRELEKRMRISKAQADALVEEMNQLAFSKIREELIKNSERKEIFTKKERGAPQATDTTPNTKPEEAQMNQEELDILHQAGIKITPHDNTPHIAGVNGKINFKIPELGKGQIHPAMLAQKLSSTVQATTVKTEHTEQIPATPPTGKIKADPYREAVE